LAAKSSTPDVVEKNFKWVICRHGAGFSKNDAAAVDFIGELIALLQLNG